MESLIALGLLILLSLVAVRLGSNALMLTGMSEEIAKFQASSAFFGVGFTTKEAELVVQHPVRRQIVHWLILVGNIGLTSALATLVVTFVDAREGHALTQTIFKVGGIGLAALGLVVLSNAAWARRPLDAMLQRVLEGFGIKKAYNYDLILNIEEGYMVSDFVVPAGHAFVNRALSETRPADEGILVMNLRRATGEFIGAPDKDVVILEGDLLMLYGHEKALLKACSPWSA